MKMAEFENLKMIAIASQKMLLLLELTTRLESFRGDGCLGRTYFLQNPLNLINPGSIS